MTRYPMVGSWRAVEACGGRPTAPATERRVGGGVAHRDTRDGERVTQACGDGGGQGTPRCKRCAGGCGAGCRAGPGRLRLMRGGGGGVPT